MALNFEDEILFAPSRAVDEDDDGEDITSDTVRYPPVVHWIKSLSDSDANNDVACRVLLIAVGPVATGFVHTYLLHNQPVEVLGVVCNGLNETVANTIGQMAVTDKSCFVYRLLEQRDTVIVQCNTDVQPEQAFSWSEQVLNRTCCAQTAVYVLSTNCVADYKSTLSPSELPRNFVRCISTSSYTGSVVCRPLEQPNIVSGLPAQIVTYCQVHSIGCVLLVCYTAAAHPEVETFNSFLPFLRAPPFNRIAKPNPNAGQQLVDFIGCWTRSKCNKQLYI